MIDQVRHNSHASGVVFLVIVFVRHYSIDGIWLEGNQGLGDCSCYWCEFGVHKRLSAR